MEPTSNSQQVWMQSSRLPSTDIVNHNGFVQSHSESIDWNSFAGGQMTEEDALITASRTSKIKPHRCLTGATGKDSIEPVWWIQFHINLNGCGGWMGGSWGGRKVETHGRCTSSSSSPYAIDIRSSDLTSLERLFGVHSAQRSIHTAAFQIGFNSQRFMASSPSFNCLRLEKSRRGFTWGNDWSRSRKWIIQQNQKRKKK